MSGVSLWYFNIVNEDMVMQWKSDVELMLSDVGVGSVNGGGVEDVEGVENVNGDESVVIYPYLLLLLPLEVHHNQLEQLESMLLS